MALAQQNAGFWSQGSLLKQAEVPSMQLRAPLDA